MSRGLIGLNRAIGSANPSRMLGVSCENSRVAEFRRWCAFFDATIGFYVDHDSMIFAPIAKFWLAGISWGSFRLGQRKIAPRSWSPICSPRLNRCFGAAVQRGEIAAPDFQINPLAKGRLAFIELQPNALRDLKIGFEALRLRKIEHWRAQRAAKQGSSLAAPKGKRQRS